MCLKEAILRRFKSGYLVAKEISPSVEEQKEMHKDVMKELQKPHILQWPIKTVT